MPRPRWAPFSDREMPRNGAASKDFVGGVPETEVKNGCH